MKFALFATLVGVALIGCGREVGQQGPQGAPGLQGSQGTTGPQGPAGSCSVRQNGTSVVITCNDGTEAEIPELEPIQLCPGSPSYPAHFIEVAYCIGGQLYGVYSANGGFMTMLPPGAYTSNGIGSACNFTVSAGCKVSQ